ncbi:OLC1v1031725C1 [Oldenlandia corymbosa var. corymbosa]|uniref:OLC1v1031725C1 n=1 Tax=Oldenlandia corymbosa var. corymbosa TaxID=529605 RepID=A0AAV1CJ89_OLDCO|nr:OLC1v1031725C1 [Oldenlandia corymbosa var. corymbosa]
MSQSARGNYFSRSATIQNIGFINFQIHQTIQETIASSRQTIFGFLVAVLINILQLKYQGKADSPFETHPKTIWLAVTFLFLYFLAQDAKLRVSEPNCYAFSRCQSFAYTGMAIFGPLSLASMSSLIFPENLGPFLYLAAILYSLSLIPFHLARRTWNRFKDFIESKMYAQDDHHERSSG